MDGGGRAALGTREGCAAGTACRAGEVDGDPRRRTQARAGRGSMRGRVGGGGGARGRCRAASGGAAPETRSWRRAHGAGVGRRRGAEDDEVGAAGAGRHRGRGAGGRRAGAAVGAGGEGGAAGTACRAGEVDGEPRWRTRASEQGARAGQRRSKFCDLGERRKGLCWGQC